MSTPIKCPSCGHWNDVTTVACEACNFPLDSDAPGSRARTAAAARPEVEPQATAATGDPAPASVAPPEAELRRVRPIRTRPPRGPQDGMSQQIWLFVGAVAIVLLVWQAFTGFHQSNFKPVAGAKPEQQQAIDEARKALEADSLDLAARIRLADLLYDTANWPEAIVNYRAANRLDSTRVTTVVDLGVCYYNLGDANTAKALFTKAIGMDPNQPVALFNLGVVAEFEKNDAAALDYYRRAQAANPPPGMVQPLTDRITGVQTKLSGATPTR